MADRTLIPTNTIVRTGVQPALTAGDAANDMYFVNDGRTLIYALDGTAAPVMTFITPGTVDTNAIANRSVTLTTHATAGNFIGPFPPSIYNQTDGTVHVDLDVSATLTLEAFRLPA